MCAVSKTTCNVKRFYQAQVQKKKKKKTPAVGQAMCKQSIRDLGKIQKQDNKIGSKQKTTNMNKKPGTTDTNTVNITKYSVK